MTNFKTSKAELLFVVLPKDAMSVCIDDNDICFIQKCITKYIGINKGYTLLANSQPLQRKLLRGCWMMCQMQVIILKHINTQGIHWI